MNALTFAQSHPDPRSDKVARGLSDKGLAVRRYLLSYDAGWETTLSMGAFEGVHRLPDLYRRHVYLAALTGLSTRSLRKLIGRLPGSVVRTNTPDFAGAAALGSGKRVIAEVYDTWSLYDDARRPGFGSWVRNVAAARAERRVHEGADLLVYTTKEMLDYAATRYEVGRAIVVPNAVVASDLPKARRRKLSEDGGSHCVYVGFLQPSNEGGSRSIVPLLREIAREHRVHVYGVTERAKADAVHRELEGIAVWHDPVPQVRLLEELTQYDFGLILLPRVDARRFDTVLPAKLFEYVCSGLPVLVSPYRALRNFVKAYGCGTVYGEGIPRGAVAVRPEFLLDTYLTRYAEEVRALGG